jgi:uncharacterized protein YbjT (DUF2867 family)
VKAADVENKIVDEANERTYIIMAPRLLTDGEMFRIIRREILKRGGKTLARGETIVLHAPGAI